MTTILPILQEALTREYAEKRTGIHVSDIIMCPRKRVFREIDPKPITNRELNFFTSGRAIHEAIQTLAKNAPLMNGSDVSSISDGVRYEVEKPININGLEAHIDLFDRELHIPIECKSMRKKEIDAPKSFHVDQLKAYMSLTNSETGLILYQLLLHFDDRPFREFVITMTKEQLAENWLWLMDEKLLLERALLHKKPEMARHIMQDKERNFQCTNCPHLKPCQEMNKKK